MIRAQTDEYIVEIGVDVGCQFFVVFTSFGGVSIGGEDVRFCSYFVTTFSTFEKGCNEVGAKSFA